MSKRKQENKYELGWSDEREDLTVVRLIGEEDEDGCVGIEEICDLKAEDVFSCIGHYMDYKGIPEFEVNGMVIKLEKKDEVEE